VKYDGVKLPKPVSRMIYQLEQLADDQTISTCELSWRADVRLIHSYTCAPELKPYRFQPGGNRRAVRWHNGRWRRLHVADVVDAMERERTETGVCYLPQHLSEDSILEELEDLRRELRCLEAMREHIRRMDATTVRYVRPSPAVSTTPISSGRI
jgi:hypothetical protein